MNSIVLQYGWECDTGCGIHNKSLSDKIPVINNEFFGTAYRCEGKDAPVVALVDRHGDRIKVCSRCQLNDIDKTIKMLISNDMSKEDLDKLYAYDSLFAVIQLIGDSIDEDKV